MATKLVTRDDLAAEIGKRVYKLRQGKRTSTGRAVSQELVAQAAGLSKGAVQLVESGKMLPGIDVIYKLAKGLGVPYTDLIPEAELEAYSRIRETLDKLRSHSRVA